MIFYDRCVSNKSRLVNNIAFESHVLSIQRSVRGSIFITGQSCVSDKDRIPRMSTKGISKIIRVLQFACGWRSINCASNFKQIFRCNSS